MGGYDQRKARHRMLHSTGMSETRRERPSHWCHWISALDAPRARGMDDEGAHLQTSLSFLISMVSNRDPGSLEEDG